MLQFFITHLEHLILSDHASVFYYLFRTFNIKLLHLYLIQKTVKIETIKEPFSYGPGKFKKKKKILYRQNFLFQYYVILS